MVLATWFGCGYFPWGPGTAGSIAAVAIAAALHAYADMGRMRLAVLILLLLTPAVWASTEAARSLKEDDPGQVVVDEVLGQWLTLLGAGVFNWKSLLLGFVLFRVFDIWKPWPVRNFEKLPEGTGIVADDLAAGVYGALILYIGGRLRIY
jgi:phosphatidylglycerophosphatase A